MLKPVAALRRWIAAGLALALLGTSAGCVGTPPRPPLPELIWPQPPEVPRISLENVLSRPRDMGIEEGAFQGFLRYLSGRPEPALVSPHGLAVDAQGRIYVVDAYLKKVHVFDRGAARHVLWPAAAGGADLVSPIGIAVDERRGRVYVSDSAQALVRVFARDSGEPLGEMRSGGMGRPTGVAVNTVTDELLVVDTVNAVVLRFALADQRLLGFIGSEGIDAGRFHAPTHIAVSRSGEIIVTDSLNFRIQVFSAKGVFVRSFGAPGDSPGYFSRPRGVAVDSDGNIYVVDALFDNVQVFDQDGRLLMAFGEPGGEPGEFWLPSGIAIDGHDRIYVADSYNKRVQVFRYLKNAEVP